MKTVQEIVEQIQKECLADDHVLLASEIVERAGEPTWEILRDQLDKEKCAEIIEAYRNEIYVNEPRYSTEIE